MTTKANEDFDKRTTQTAEVVQSSAVFVFATPRRWPGKATWLAAKRAQGSWADVRAYDANDLEQWLEQAPAVRLQFAEELGLSGPGTESVDHYWRTWAAQTREEITTTAILTGRDDIKAQLATRLTTSNQSISEPLSIQADSVEEAVAFACACIIGELSLSNHTVVVTAIDGWRFVEGNTGITIAVAARPEYAERPTNRPNLKVIIPFAAGDVSGHFRGAASLDERADFSLERLEHDQFEKALIDIGIDHGDAERLSRATGRSWSVFVRQRSRNPALHTPRWLNLPQSHALATMCLVGGWSTENKADQAIVEQIAGRPYHEMEGDFSVLSAAEDAPVMRIDRVWKAKSPIELLALFGPQMTSSELDRFFSALRSILIEPDPELELPPDERYAAQIHGKVRPQSGLLIRSLCDTLIKIAVRGVDIPGLQHLQLQERAAAFVRNILNSANTSRWLSLSSLLRPLAEAAPDDFLKAIERSLSAPDQPVTALIRETGSSAMFGRCYHADLLWALELLAWAPERLTRVACILAQLSTIPIKGNWGNAPQRSLLNLYRSWLPQTSATIEQRIASLDRLIGAHPDAAFALVDSLVHTYGDMAMPSMRPRWRDDDAGSGRGVPSYERHKMLVEAAERMLSLAVDNASRAVTLIEKISIFDSSRVARVLALCRDFTTADTSDHDRALVRSALRKHINRARNYGRLKGAALESHLRPIESLYEELTPANLIGRHAWLFENNWPDLPTRVRDENYQERVRLLDMLRTDAVREVYANSGLSGIADLCSVTNGNYVGFTVAKLYPEIDIPCRWVLSIECDFNRSHWLAHMLGGLLRGLPEAVSVTLLRDIGLKGQAVGWDAEKLARVAALMPERRTTWDVVSEFGADVDKAYWSLMSPGYWLADSGPDFEVALKRLMAAERPRTALSMCRFEIGKVEPTLVAEMLEQMLQGQEENGPLLDSWDVHKAIEVLEQSNSIDRDRLIRIEFGLIPALGYEGEHHAKALYEALMSDARLFAELITALYKPEHREREEPISEHLKVVAELAWRVLHACQRQPGTQPDGSIDCKEFRAFVDEARRLCREADRLTMCDQTLGQIMAHAPADADGNWPFEPARDVLDRPKHEEMRTGFRIGAFNKRGVTSRAYNEGGTQEREWASQYRRHAQALHNSHVFVAAAFREPRTRI